MGDDTGMCGEIELGFDSSGQGYSRYSSRLGYRDHTGVIYSISSDPTAG